MRSAGSDPTLAIELTKTIRCPQVGQLELLVICLLIRFSLTELLALSAFRRLAESLSDELALANPKPVHRTLILVKVPC